MRSLLISVVAIMVTAFSASAYTTSYLQTPLYVVNGEAMTVEEVQSIAATDIESMTVLSDPKQTREFTHLGDISNGVVVITLKEGDKEEMVFIETDVMPTFMGGDLVTFRNWVMQNVRYPAEAMEKKIEGSVIVQFVVNREGYILVDAINVMHSDNELFTEEVKRVMSLSPRWTPGIQNGSAVAVSLTLPIRFEISVEEGGIGNPNGRLTIEGDEIVIQQRNSNVKRYFGKNRPIYIVDGVPATVEEVKALPTQQILRVAILDDEEHLTYYKDFGDTSNGVVIIHTKSSDEDVVSSPDTPPSFMGGDWNTFYAWIMQNIRYPEELAKRDLAAHIVVKFIVNSQGFVEVVDITTIKGTAHPLLHQEVNRVLNSSPRWSPAVHDGRPVACQGTLPIIFGSMEI